MSRPIVFDFRGKWIQSGAVLLLSRYHSLCKSNNMRVCTLFQRDSIENSAISLSLWRSRTIITWSVFTRPQPWRTPIGRRFSWAKRQTCWCWTRRIIICSWIDWMYWWREREGHWWRRVKWIRFKSFLERIIMCFTSQIESCYLVISVDFEVFELEYDK